MSIAAEICESGKRVKEGWRQDSFKPEEALLTTNFWYILMIKPRALVDGLNVAYERKQAVKGTSG